MTTINYDRNGTSVTGTQLTVEPDSVLFAYLDEHSDKLPSTLELKRRLPSNTSSVNAVRRLFVNRRTSVIVDAGLETEHTSPLIVKLECSIPTGVSDEDVKSSIADIVGVVSDDTVFADFRKHGILP